MSLPRGKCLTCERVVVLRRGDVAGKHKHAGRHCAGSGKKAEPAPREVYRRAEVALQELERSVVTQADKDRIARVWQGMRAIDDAQAQLRVDLEDLCIEYTNPNAPSDDCDRLITEVRTIIQSAVAAS